MTNPNHVILISEHVYESPRRAGFHWLADAYREAGWHALFVTAGVSSLSALRGDVRVGLVAPEQRNRIRSIAPDLDGLFWYPPFHPVNLRHDVLNRLSQPFFRSYNRLPIGALEQAVRGAATVIFESGAGLSLARRVRRLAPQALFVYRVSDDVRVIGAHPVLEAFEREATSSFDLISVPSDHMVGLFPPAAPVVVQYHGLNKALFDEGRPDPYSGGKNVISVGTTLFDRRAVEVLAASSPAVQFHLFGRISEPFIQPNVVLYGEKRFIELVPYIQHADAGLAPYLYRRGCEYLAHTSNKVMQYTYARLPILLPSFIPNNAGHIVQYTPGDEQSARNAVNQALTIDHGEVDRSAIRGWDAVYVDIERHRPAG
jgi:2-beta-glucuronyltransferase